MSERGAMSVDHMPERSAGQGGIIAVVVTLNPDVSTFDALLEATRAQVDRIVVIDNGSRSDSVRQIARLCDGRAELDTLPQNAGIAAAQNRGIEMAKAAGATDVLLLDHDSVPDAGMVAALSATANKLRASGVSIGAVGPVIVDRQSLAVAPLPHIVDGAVRFLPAPESQPTECEYLIASGTLISIEAFRAVGPFDEAYFVDQVDIEWCLRAKRAGFAVVCVPQARLQHAIGDEVVSFWLLGPRQIAVHSPVRDYFYFRNSLRLIRTTTVPLPWRRFWARRLLRLFVLQTLFVPPRLARTRAMFRGLREGLCKS
jgi:rhamnosyltransferase